MVGIDKSPVQGDTFSEIKIVWPFRLHPDHCHARRCFFAGIRAAGPDMKLTADNYLTIADMMDIRVVSNLGLVDKDIEGLSRLDG